MGMPTDLMLVRHGQSTGNVATHAARNGDESHFTDEFTTTPGHQWELTATGRAQAQVTGAWLEQFGVAVRYYCSPFVRTRQTAAALGLSEGREPTWRLNRDLRERDWGDIGSVPDSVFRSRPEYELNAVARDTDPLYWCPPNGESLARVAENRVRNFLDTLHRTTGKGRVVAVTHGETMLAFRLMLERLSDEEFAALLRDRAQRPVNAEVFHYSQVRPADEDLDPEPPGDVRGTQHEGVSAAASGDRGRAPGVTDGLEGAGTGPGSLAGHLAWMRRAAPRFHPAGVARSPQVTPPASTSEVGTEVGTEGGSAGPAGFTVPDVVDGVHGVWAMHVSRWRPVRFHLLTNDELLHS